MYVEVQDFITYVDVEVQDVGILKFIIFTNE
jgi:hypothetical protein